MLCIAINHVLAICIIKSITWPRDPVGIFIFPQTAFGTDFSEQWNAKSLGITSPVDESETIFSYITNKALKGVDVSFRSFYPSLNQVLYMN